MISAEEKELERDFTKAFLQTIGISPQIILQDHEEPDFILHYSSLIGIEVTQLFSEPSSGEIQRVWIEGGWEDVLQLALKLWNAKAKPKVDVRIIFNDSIHIPTTEKPILANELIKRVDQYLPTLGESFWSSDVLVVLPTWLVELHIHRHSEVEPSTWRFSDAGWTPFIYNQLIQKRLTKKEELRTK